MTMTGQDTLGTRRTLEAGGKSYDYYSLSAASEKIGDVSRLPFSLKVLLENLLRFEDGTSVTVDDVKAMAGWLENKSSDREIAYRPARVLMQDFTGVPAVVDLAAMRDAMTKMGGDPEKINPLSPCDLVIDHSVMVDYFGGPDAFKKNVELEFERNGERYEFLRWGQTAFDNFRVVPPGTGICHQVNVEYLARAVWSSAEKGGSAEIAYPDTLVGTDSHTTMVNGLGVLGWGVGGIEAEAAMLGQPVTMLIPEVIGFKLSGKLKEGMTATDLVLTVTQMLRAKGVVGKFVEFYGDGLDNLTLADRATIANMAPEYGATCGIFPIDAETIRYLEFSGRDADTIALAEAYAKAQGMWREAGSADPVFTDSLELDLDQVEPSLAGPKRPQDRVALSGMPENIATVFEERGHSDRSVPVEGTDYALEDGAVVIAAITSCTNTSNPAVLIAAGLVARKAREKGLTVKPWVKTSLAPGSQVVTDYLEKAGLQDDLNALGFDLVGYGCTTCIGNSGPLPDPIAAAIDTGDLVTAAVLSGNRNFEGRVSPQTRANYLASPPLVVAYALAGNAKINVATDPLGEDQDGNPVYLKDIWPSNHEIQDTIQRALTSEMFKSRYGNVFHGPDEWRAINVTGGQTYEWNSGSTYVQHPPYFEDMAADPSEPGDIAGARPLLMMGDSVTTDHISPAGSFKPDTPAGEYLTERQVRPKDFNSYGARRGNHEVMMRGTFGNIRIKNQLVGSKEGAWTIKFPEGEETFNYDAAMQYMQEKIPLVVLGGKEYGTGSSRDWAAKGTNLLGIKAVITQSYERIHRNNLVGMGILPLIFQEGENAASLGLDGTETYFVEEIENMQPRKTVKVRAVKKDGSTVAFTTTARLDTEVDVDYFHHGGILPYVLRKLMVS
jgi:aconitate hydratase